MQDLNTLVETHPSIKKMLSYIRPTFKGCAAIPTPEINIHISSAPVYVEEEISLYLTISFILTSSDFMKASDTLFKMGDDKPTMNLMPAIDPGWFISVPDNDGFSIGLELWPKNSVEFGFSYALDDNDLKCTNHELNIIKEQLKKATHALF